MVSRFGIQKEMSQTPASYPRSPQKRSVHCNRKEREWFLKLWLRMGYGFFITTKSNDNDWKRWAKESTGQNHWKKKDQETK